MKITMTKNIKIIPQLLLFILFLSQAPLSAKAAHLYRAPENLLTLSIPDHFTSLNLSKTDHRVFSHSAYTYKTNDRHVVLHILITKATTDDSIKIFKNEHENKLKNLSNYSLLSEGEDETNNNLIKTFFYSFALEDNKKFPIYRYDALTVTAIRALSVTGAQKQINKANYRILIYLEGSKKGVFFNIGTFKNILKSISLPQNHSTKVTSLSERIKQLKNRRKDDLTYGTKQRQTHPNTQTRNNNQINTDGETNTGSNTLPSGNQQNPTNSKVHTAIPGPPVIVAGDPPLTVKTIAAWKTLLEWTSRTRLTMAQEEDLKKALIVHYKAGGTPRQTVLSFTDTLSPYHLYSLPPSKATILREKLTAKLKEMSKGKNIAGDGWNLFDRIFYSQHAVLVKDNPPLTLQARDGILEMLFFIQSLIQNDHTIIIEGNKTTENKIQFSANIRNKWNDFAKIEREGLSDILFQWSEIRLLWMIVKKEDKQKIINGVKQDTQKICTLSGLSLSDPDNRKKHRLSTLFMKAAIDNPPILSILAAKVSNQLKDVLTKN